MRQNNETEKSSNELKENAQAIREQKQRSTTLHVQNKVKTAYKRA
ncbi:hypothetical protein [Helicobacter pylori]|nr:hypothetical protein [Helicobacter pylori]